MSELTAETIMDVIRYWDIARLTYQRLQTNQHLPVVAQDPGWRQDMEAALTELGDAGYVLADSEDRIERMQGPHDRGA